MLDRRLISASSPRAPGALERASAWVTEPINAEGDTLYTATMTLLTSAYSRNLTSPILDVFLLAASEAGSAEVFAEAVRRVVRDDLTMPSPARLVQVIGEITTARYLDERRADGAEVAVAERPSTRQLVERHFAVTAGDRTWWRDLVRAQRLPEVWFDERRALFVPPQEFHGAAVLVGTSLALAWWQSPARARTRRAVEDQLVLRYGPRQPWLAIIVRPDLLADTPWEGGDDGPSELSPGAAAPQRGDTASAALADDVSGSPRGGDSADGGDGTTGGAAPRGGGARRG